MTKFKSENKKVVLTEILFRLSLIAVLVSFSACKDQKKEAKQDDSTGDLISVHENNTTVEAYINFIAEDQNKMTLDHAYTSEAITKLTAAINAMADEIDYNIQGDLDQVKEYADKITKDPFDTAHADNVRKAADTSTDILQNMQKAKYPGLEQEVSELRSASASIKPETLLLDQKDAVKSFFNKAADVLKKMN